MKRYFYMICLFLSSALVGFGQPPMEDFDDKGERVEAAKVAYITTRLNLTTIQAQQFWPVFNEFEAGKKKIRKQLRLLKTDNMMVDATEDQLKTDIKKMFSLRQEELDLEKSFAEKFLKTITAKQLSEFYMAEREFTKMLLKRIGEHRKEKMGRRH